MIDQTNNQPPTTDAPAPSIAVAVDGCIAEDKECVECGYNLRGLKTDALCPECAAEIANSLRNYELQYAPLPWLRIVSRGFQFLRLAAIIFAVILVVDVLIVPTSMIMNTSFLKNPGIIAEIIMQGFILLSGLAMLIGALAALIGLIFSTRPEPRLIGRESPTSNRRLARGFIMAFLTTLLVLMLVEDCLPHAPWTDVVVLYLPSVIIITLLLALLCYINYVVALLRRTAEQKAVKSANDLTNLVYLGLILAAVSMLAQALAPALQSTPAASAIGNVAHFSEGCGSCVGLLTAVGFITLMLRVAAITRRSVALAEQSEKDRQSPPPQADLSSDSPPSAST